MIKNIRHAAIVVSDLDKSRRFYETFFGFTLVKEDIETGPFIEKVVGLSGVRLHWVKLRMPNGVLLELLKYLSPELPLSANEKRKKQVSNMLGHSHLAFTVDNMDRFIETLEINGGAAVNLPEINLEKSAKVCYIYDPEGNILEIVEEI
jgi:catechol 2,3-dioxygenase-like lactoylglutathione lyase family enzyme